MSDQNDIELTMLRSFYESWVNLHAIKNDKLHRRQKEQAAQILVDHAHQLKNYYLPTIDLRAVK